MVRKSVKYANNFAICLIADGKRRDENKNKNENERKNTSAVDVVRRRLDELIGFPTGYKN